MDNPPLFTLDDNIPSGGDKKVPTLQQLEDNHNVSHKNVIEKDCCSLVNTHP